MHTGMFFAFCVMSYKTESLSIEACTVRENLFPSMDRLYNPSHTQKRSVPYQTAAINCAAIFIFLQSFIISSVALGYAMLATLFGCCCCLVKTLLKAQRFSSPVFGSLLRFSNSKSMRLNRSHRAARNANAETVCLQKNQRPEFPFDLRKKFSFVSP